MSTPTQTTEFFDTLAKVLLRCALFGFLLLLFWFGVILLAEDLVCSVHGRMFGLTPHELNPLLRHGSPQTRRGLLVPAAMGGNPTRPQKTVGLTKSKYDDRRRRGGSARPER